MSTSSYLFEDSPIHHSELVNIEQLWYSLATACPPLTRLSILVDAYMDAGHTTTSDFIRWIVMNQRIPIKARKVRNRSSNGIYWKFFTMEYMIFSRRKKHILPIDFAVDPHKDINGTYRYTCYMALIQAFITLPPEKQEKVLMTRYPL